MTDLNEFSSDISTKMTCQGKLEEQPETDEDLRTRNNTSTLDESLECNLEEIESSVKTVKLELDCAYDDIKKDLPEVKKEVISQVIDKTNQLMENTSKVIKEAKTTKSQFQFLRELIESQEKRSSDKFKSQEEKFQKQIDCLVTKNTELTDKVKSLEIHVENLEARNNDMEKQLLPLLSRESLECFIHHIFNVEEKHQSVPGLNGKLYFRMIAFIQEYVKKIANNKVQGKDIFPQKTYDVFVPSSNESETSKKIQIPANPFFPWKRFYEWIKQKFNSDNALFEKIKNSFFDINPKTYSEDLNEKKEVVEVQQEVQQSNSWKNKKTTDEIEVQLIKAYGKFLHSINVFYDLNFDEIPESTGKLILMLIFEFFKQDIELKNMYKLSESEKLKKNTSNSQTNLDNNINNEETVNVFNSSNLTHFKNSSNTIKIDIACEANNSSSINKTPEVKDHKNSEDA